MQPIITTIQLEPGDAYVFCVAALGNAVTIGSNRRLDLTRISKPEPGVLCCWANIIRDY